MVYRIVLNHIDAEVADFPENNYIDSLRIY